MGNHRLVEAVGLGAEQLPPEVVLVLDPKRCIVGMAVTVDSQQ